MTSFKKLKTAKYRILKRNEASYINGGAISCSVIRDECISKCGDDQSYCFLFCMDDAGCPLY
ncbi:hypothetical protein [Aquimarina algicola]|uniref:Bacteriocin n=1 Tax=Aquimarina algicola TaxID=2589995 RepID=A0A504J3N8_9FLAO|nr:hypothetical protein [Aquimarina algicola]TPN81699.1 hypothetical protein FHK87_24175 [Aquimarina algicola]